MAAPATPTNFYVQQGNNQAYLLWDLMSGATSYEVQRSTDGITYANYASVTTNSYLDTGVTPGNTYFYQVAASNGVLSAYTTPAAVTITGTGFMTLAQVRLAAQQRADRVGSNFVTLPEWNSYIVQSYFELYDLLVDTYEDYFMAAPVSITSDGSTYLYDLPNGTNYTNAKPFYKLAGVDLALNSAANSYVTVNKFNFIDRNRFVYPNTASTIYGVFNLQYRLVGNQIEFIPTPASGQQIRIWYIPRLTQPLQETDLLDGVSGWTEYVIVDAAIKALQKEESDVSVLMAQKEALIKRIEESAMNRDVGQADRISDVRQGNWSDGWWGGRNGMVGGW